MNSQPQLQHIYTLYTQYICMYVSLEMYAYSYMCTLQVDSYIKYMQSCNNSYLRTISKYVCMYFENI